MQTFVSGFLRKKAKIFTRKGKKRFPGGPESVYQGLAHNQQREGKEQEHSANPFGCAGEFCVHCFGLVLCQEGIGHAANGAGEASVLAGLEEYHQDDTQAAEEL